MSVALSALLLLIFLIPGIIFSRFYYSEEFSKHYFKSSFTELLFANILPSFALHYIWLELIGYWVDGLNWHIDFILIGNLLSQGDVADAFKRLEEAKASLATYHFTLFAFSAITGYLWKVLVRKLSFDLRYKFFRFRNHYHYLLNGQIFSFPEASVELKHDKYKDIELRYIDALVETNEGIIIYDGFLVDYKLSSNEGLEYLVLTEVRRRFIENGVEMPESFEDKVSRDSEKKEVKKQGGQIISKKYHSISGHYMILPYSTIKNLNISFYKIERKESSNQLKVIPVS